MPQTRLFYSRPNKKSSTIFSFFRIFSPGIPPAPGPCAQISAKITACVFLLRTHGNSHKKGTPGGVPLRFQQQPQLLLSQVFQLAAQPLPLPQPQPPLPPQLQKISSRMMIHHQLLPEKQPQMPLLLLHIILTSESFFVSSVLTLHVMTGADFCESAGGRIFKARLPHRRSRD